MARFKCAKPFMPVQGVEINTFGQERLDKTVAELLSEREAVSDLLVGS